MGKLTTLSAAIQSHVHSGDTIYAAGFTHLIPFAAGHEIIRQGLRDLVIARATPDLIYDQLVAAGCARKVIFSYMGNPGVGSLHVVRSEIEAGRLKWEEYSHFSMITRLQAGAAGLPFLPMNPTAALDLEKANPLYRKVKDPYSDREVVTVPALNPDVAIVHVQRADSEGNAHIWGIIGEQKEAAFAARRVILTAEEIVSQELIRSDPNRTQGYYDRDNAFYLKWDSISRDTNTVQTYLEEWVYGVKDRADYWQKLGPEVHAQLQVNSRPSEPVNYGRY
jgi:glutaconate CoA-transferase subunit A